MSRGPPGVFLGDLRATGKNPRSCDASDFERQTRSEEESVSMERYADDERRSITPKSPRPEGFWQGGHVCCVAPQGAEPSRPQRISPLIRVRRRALHPWPPRSKRNLRGLFPVALRPRKSHLERVQAAQGKRVWTDWVSLRRAWFFDWRPLQALRQAGLLQGRNCRGGGLRVHRAWSGSSFRRGSSNPRCGL